MAMPSEPAPSVSGHSGLTRNGSKCLSQAHQARIRMIAIEGNGSEAVALIQRDGFFKMGQRVQLDLAIAERFGSGDGGSDQRLAHAKPARLGPHIQPLE